MPNPVRHSGGMTLVELMVAMLISAIVMVGMGIFMFDTHQGWLKTYKRVHGGVVSDGATTKAAFEKIVRKASHKQYSLPAVDELIVYYYRDWQNSTSLDRYARFYRPLNQQNRIVVEHGDIGSTMNTNSIVLTENVRDVVFRPTPGALQMMLSLSDNSENITVVSTALMHNE